MRKIITKKIRVSEEEKRREVTEYNEFEDAHEDVEAFVKKEIYDEYVELICVDCGKEDGVEYDIFCRNVQI